MKRLHVMSVIDEMRIGGAERLLVDVLNNLPREDVESTLVLLHEHEQASLVLRDLASDIRVIRLDAPRKRGPQLLPKLIATVRSHRPDLVHTHLFRSNIWGGVAAHAGRAFHLATEHGPMVKPGTPLHTTEMANRTRHLLPRRALARVGTRFLAVSDYVARSVSEVTRISRDHYHVVYNGVELARFAPRSGRRVRDSLGLPATSVVLGMCGRLVDWKGGERFALAARIALEQDRNLRVLIVGDGPCRGAIERILQPVADRVHLVGYQQDVSDYVAAIDVFVAPSQLHTLDIVLYEAMLMGRACIVVKSGGSADPWFCDAPVSFVPLNANIEELAAVMTLVGADRVMRERLGASAMSYARSHFDIKRTVAEYIELYRRLLDRAP